MLLVIRLAYFALQALFALVVLALWELFLLFIFTFAIVCSAVFYCVWLPILALRASYLYLEYRTPFGRTWKSEYYLGVAYNPDNTLKKNAEALLLEPIGNIFWRIKRDYLHAFAEA